MKLTLGRKFFLYTSVMLVGVLLVTFVVLERSQARQWEAYLRTQSVAFASFATPEVLKLFRGGFRSPSNTDVELVADFLALNSDLVSFSLVSGNGTLLYQSAAFPAFAELGKQVRELPLDTKLLSTEVTEAVTRRLPGGERLLELLTPAFSPTGTRILSVRYLISYRSVDQRLGEMQRQFLVIALITSLFVMFLTALLVRKLTRPVEALTNGVKAIGQGALETQIEVAGQDEISTLGIAFNEMVASLTRQRQEVEVKTHELQESNRVLSEVQDQLLRAERLATIGQLAAGVSHEIDNPVGIILGYTELLLEDLAPGDPRREDLLAIVDECRRCKRITGGLLGLARTAPEEQIPIDMTLLVRDIFDTLKPQKLFRRVQLEFSADDNLPLLTGDQDRLRQVLINLFLNSAQAMAGSGSLTVSATTENDELLLRVCDSGPGVPPELQSRIFQPFVTTKGRDEGTGLGLPLCRKLVEDHQGRIDLEPSEQGACFVLRFPAVQRENSFDNDPADSLG